MTVRLRFVLFFVAGVAMAIAPVAILVGTGIMRVNEGLPTRALAGGIAASVAILAVAAAALIVVLRTFDRPVKQLLKAIAEVADGNLSPELPRGAPAEFGQINEAVDTMCGQMRMVLSQLSTLSGHVVKSTDGAADAFNEIFEGVKAQSKTASRTLDAVGQVSDGLLEASKGIEEMTQRIDESASQVSQMDLAIGNVSETIDGLSSIIEQASQTTREGDKNARILAGDISDLTTQVGAAQGALHEVVEGAQRARGDAGEAAVILRNLEAETQRIGAAIGATIEGSDAVHLSNERILEVTASLESRVDRVDDVLEVIGNLAERTKLLSINASIIASEAGEHGRAFAVVAHEVKELAQSTGGAISEISKVVGSLKEGFALTVAAIQKGQQDVDRGVRLARDAVVLLRNIPDEVFKAAALGHEIAKRTERQVERGAQVEEIFGRVMSTLNQVGQILSEQVNRNARTLALFQSIRLTAEQVLRLTQQHADASRSVTRTVEEISADFRSMASGVRDHVAGLNNLVNLSEEVLSTTESNRRRAEELSHLLGALNRYALYLGEDFRKLGGEDRA